MKKILLLFLFSSSLMAQYQPNLLFANKEQNIDYGGTIKTTNSANDVSGNTYLIGTFSNLTDFDPTMAENLLSSIGSSDMFISKYDSSGMYLWTKIIGGTGTVNPTAIVIDGSNMYIAGNYNNTIDFDPSANVTNLTAINFYDSSFIAKYDLNASLIACESLDVLVDSSNTINDIKFKNNQLVITGNVFGTVDFDPSVITSNISSNGYNYIGYIARYSDSLSLLGVFSFGEVDKRSTGTSLAYDADGNILVSGTFTGNVDFDPSPSVFSLNSNNATHTFIAKYTASGIFQWVKNIQAIGTTFFTVPKLVLDTSNNIFVAGSFGTTSDFDPSPAIATLSASASDIFIAKYDPNGNYLWANKIGSTGNDFCHNIAIDTSNNIYIYGTFSNTVDFNTGVGVNNLVATNGTNYFAKYNSNGVFLNANNLFNSTITTMHVDNSDNLLLSGTYNGTVDFDPSIGIANLFSSQTNIFFTKYASSGSYIYAKSIGGDKPVNDLISYIATDALGSIYRAGNLSASTDIDPSSNNFNVSSTNAPGIFMSKNTDGGNFLWANSLTGTISLRLSTMNTDTAGNMYLAGSFLGTVDFDPSANTVNLTSIGTTNPDLFIAKYDPNGNYLWVKRISGNLSARRNIVVDDLGNVYFSGNFSGGTIDFDPSPSGVYFLTPSPFTIANPFFIKLNAAGDFIWAKSFTFSTQSTNASIVQFDIKDNYIYIGGQFSGPVDFNPSPTETNTLSTGFGFPETFFAKYDLNGEYQLAFKFRNNEPAGGFVINSASSFSMDSNGDIFILSIFTNTVDFDPSPSETFNLTSNEQSYNLAVVKLTSNGSFIWAKKIRPVSEFSWFNTNNSIQSGVWRSNSFIINDELIFAATIYGNIDFDPSSNDYVLNSSLNASGNFDFNLFVAKYNKLNGNFISANKIDGNNTGELFNACLDNNQNLLLSGSFMGTADFDLSAEVQNLASASPYNHDRFWAKYDSNTLGIGANIIEKGYRIYPNPTNSLLYVSHENNDDFKVTIIDISGKILQKTTLTNYIGIDVSVYPQGIYFIQIENGIERNTYKFIKK